MTRVFRATAVLALPLVFGIGLLTSSAAKEPVAAEALFTFTDPEILESSGLVARQDLVVTVNDSGDGNRIFTVDPATGDTVGVTRFAGEAVDVEALAPAGPGYSGGSVGSGEIYVGDIGDNFARREAITVTRVPFGRAAELPAEVAGVGYELTYPDGAHDAESLLVHPVTGRLFVVAKEFIGRLYAAPERLSSTGPNELEFVDEVIGIATDGAFFPDGKHVVLRNYTQAAIYTWPGLRQIARLDLPPQQQGEGIAVTEDDEVLLSSEGLNTEVLRIELPAEVRAQLAGQAGPAEPSEEPTGPGITDPEESGNLADDDPDTDPWPGVLLSPWLVGGVGGLVVLVVVLRLARARR